MNVQAHTKPQSDVLQLTRPIAAPRQAVFAALTQAEALAAWFGPDGVTARRSRSTFGPAAATALRCTTPTAW